MALGLAKHQQLLKNFSFLLFLMIRYFSKFTENIFTEQSFFYFFLFLATLFDFAYFFGLFFLPNLIDQCNYTRIQTPPCLSLDLLHYRLSFYSYPLFLAGKFIHEVSTSLYVRTFVSICLLISFLSYLSSHQHINKCINLVLNEMQSFFLSQLTF